MPSLGTTAFIPSSTCFLLQHWIPALWATTGAFHRHFGIRILSGQCLALALWKAFQQRLLLPLLGYASDSRSRKHIRPPDSSRWLCAFPSL